MRILVVGAGSTGGYFGGRLAQAGRDVTFLVRAGRAAQLRKGGLQIVSPNGDVTLTPQLVTADAIPGTYDAVPITVKAYSLDAALDEDTMAMECTIDVHIRALRRKLGEKSVVIETVRGVGYRFRDVTSMVEAEDA